MSFIDEQYEYELPESMIAQEPSPERSASRLLVLDRRRERIEHRRFGDISRYLETGDCLVINDTKVIKARLVARTAGGREVELLMVRPGQGKEWEAMTRPAKKVRTGEMLYLDDAAARVFVRRELADGRRVVEFDGIEPFTALEKFGRVPLPPYIRREPRETDRARYQTVYAARPGAVAAPTAGLHFTRRLLAALEEKGVDVVTVCLHVGPGTFQPIRTERVEDHRQESEYYELSRESAGGLNRVRSRGGRVVAVGTTVVRVLETIGRAPHEEMKGWTDITICPPYVFGNVDVLLTNFHLPRASTLLLAAAFAGRELLGEAYRQAVESNYRFYSYGDAMLII